MLKPVSMCKDLLLFLSQSTSSMEATNSQQVHQSNAFSKSTKHDMAAGRPFRYPDYENPSPQSSGQSSVSEAYEKLLVWDSRVKQHIVSPDNYVHNTKCSASFTYGQHSPEHKAPERPRRIHSAVLNDSGYLSREYLDLKDSAEVGEFVWILDQRMAWTMECTHSRLKHGSDDIILHVLEKWVGMLDTWDNSATLAFYEPTWMSSLVPIWCFPIFWHSVCIIGMSDSLFFGR